MEVKDFNVETDVGTDLYHFIDYTLRKDFEGPKIQRAINLVFGQLIHHIFNMDKNNNEVSFFVSLRRERNRDFIFNLNISTEDAVNFRITTGEVHEGDLMGWIDDLENREPDGSLFIQKLTYFMTSYLFEAGTATEDNKEAFDDMWESLSEGYAIAIEKVLSDRGIKM